MSCFLFKLLTVTDFLQQQLSSYLDVLAYYSSLMCSPHACCLACTCMERCNVFLASH